MKAVKVYNDMYRANITCLVGGMPQDIPKYCRRIHGRDARFFSWSTEFQWGDDADTTDGYQFHVNAPLGNGEVFYIWVSEASPYLLFHEIYHVVGDIMHTRGVTYSDESEESFAYLGSWIFEKFFNKLRKQVLATK